MYPREEAARLRKLFWTAFGRYMSRHVSERGPKIKWLNYKTGIRQVYFRLHADNKIARVSIDLQHKDPEIRLLFFEQFEELKHLLHNTTGSEWIWEPVFYDDAGNELSRIYQEIPGVNIYQKETWPVAFEFFQSLLLPLDEIWANAIEVFLDLQN